MLHAQAFYALFRKTPNEKGSNYAKRLSEELPKGSMQGSCSQKDQPGTGTHLGTERNSVNSSTD